MKSKPTKLTLRMDDELVRRAKSYAKRSGKSVSAIVADFFELLDQAQEQQRLRLTPAVRSLFGVMEGADLKKEDYRRYVERKHR